MEMKVIIRSIKINNVSGASSVNIGTTLNLLSKSVAQEEDGGQNQPPEKPDQPTQEPPTPQPPTPQPPNPVVPQPPVPEAPVVTREPSAQED
jgi:hypothetical protein